jgi:tetratricopeptide (TPR) repeat protein
MHLGNEAAVKARYDQLLEQQPTNSSLAYLRGRICTRRHEALPYYEKALRLDTNNAFAHNATAFVCAGTGDWPTALKHAARAVELAPDDPQMQELLFDSQLAAGSLSEMEKQWRAAVQARPTDLLAHLKLATVLAAGNQTNALEELVQRYAMNIPAQGGMHNDLLQLRYQAAYLIADFKQLLALVQENPKAFESFEKFQALIAAGRLEEIDQLLRPQNARAFDPFHVLLVGLAWEAAGHPDRAAPWLQEALNQLRSERPEYAVAADMLTHPEQTALTDVLDLGIAPHFKALLLAALSRHHPQQAEPMRKAARLLNVRREFPYHSINQLTEGTAPAP